MAVAAVAAAAVAAELVITQIMPLMMRWAV
jgi:hypothetical protein